MGNGDCYNCSHGLPCSKNNGSGTSRAMVRAPSQNATALVAARSIESTLALILNEASATGDPVAAIAHRYGEAKAAVSQLSAIRAAPPPSRACGKDSTLAEHACFDFGCKKLPPVWFSRDRAHRTASARYDLSASDYSSMSNVAAFGRVVQRMCEANGQINPVPTSWAGSNTVLVNDATWPGNDGIQDLGIVGVEIEWKVPHEMQSAPALDIVVGSWNESTGPDLLPFDQTRPNYQTANVVARRVRVYLDTPCQRGYIYIPLGFRATRGSDIARPCYCKVNEATFDQSVTSGFVLDLQGADSDYSFIARGMFSESDATRRGLDALLETLSEEEDSNG